MHVVHLDTRDPRPRPVPRTWIGGACHSEQRASYDAANPVPEWTYLSVTAAVTAVTCRAVDWTYAFHRLPTPDGRAPSWVKVRWILDTWKSLPDRVMILDSDAWIRDGPGLKFVLDQHFESGAKIVFAGEPPAKETRAHEADVVNGGFLCFKKDTACRDYFQATWDLANPGSRCHEYANAWPWEQACLAASEPWMRVLPVTLCNTPAGSLVSHCWYKDIAGTLAMHDLLLALHADIHPETAPSTNAELVVARYTEDVSWVMEYANLVSRITVYNKGPPLTPFHPKMRVVDLPNLGREAHTFAHHMASEYGSLCDVIVFSQGTWTDHVSRDSFAGMISGVEPPTRTGLDAGWSDTLMERLGWTPERNYSASVMTPAGMTLGKFYLKYIASDLVPESEVTWWQNAVFCATRDQVHGRAAAEYSDLVGALETENPETGHYMERFWRALLTTEAASR